MSCRIVSVCVRSYYGPGEVSATLISSARAMDGGLNDAQELGEGIWNQGVHQIMWIDLRTHEKKQNRRRHDVCLLKPVAMCQWQLHGID